ncbi:MAG: NanQ anomerase/TabA/YiaL family protein [Planctomycetota bacterium]|jgi:YhcH/YjgK/YiaL family protein
MIVDKLENAHLYAGLSDKINIAFGILKDKKLFLKKDGRYEIDGDNLYYIVQRYETRPADQCKLEAHKKYIDIQFVAAGEEILGYTPLENLEISQPYNEEKDIVLYKVSDKLSTVNLGPGMFCILFPQDAHMPGRQLNDPSNVLKVVVKVKINA